MKYDEFVKMDEQGATHWWYRARRRLLRNDLQISADDKERLKILDLASACGDNFFVCKDIGDYYGLDISWDAINYCKQKNISTIVQGDAHYLPFKSDTFDVIIALDVFEHLDDDLISMKEIWRVLKNNGKLIFNTPAFMLLYSNHDRAFHHYRRYRTKELRKKLTQADFTINFMSYWSFFIFPAVFIMRKVFSPTSNINEENLSDFHIKIPRIIEKIFNLLSLIETTFIKNNISFPFGVSLYGTAQKRK
ncbi:MAG: class I SAM-dependent methyltransferase [Candidatus Latescibacteria bacterium]|nr:class I SAM-dependent methyltransferase [Candidatus Latescibacterota bacterium]